MMGDIVLIRAERNSFGHRVRGVKGRIKDGAELLKQEEKRY